MNRKQLSTVLARIIAGTATKSELEQATISAVTMLTTADTKLKKLAPFVKGVTEEDRLYQIEEGVWKRKAKIKGALSWVRANAPSDFSEPSAPNGISNSAGSGNCGDPPVAEVVRRFGSGR